MDIYDKCNQSIRICDIKQSSICRPEDMMCLESKHELLYNLNNYMFIFSGNDSDNVKPRKSFNDMNFSFIIDKKKFLPSYIYLFIYQCADDLNNFCSVTEKDYDNKDGRIPLLTLKEQKHFLRNLF